MQLREWAESKKCPEQENNFCLSSFVKMSGLLRGLPTVSCRKGHHGFLTKRWKEKAKEETETTRSSFILKINCVFACHAVNICHLFYAEINWWRKKKQFTRKLVLDIFISKIPACSYCWAEIFFFLLFTLMFLYLHQLINCSDFFSFPITKVTL